MFVCIYFCLLREREKADNVGAKNRKGFKIRLGCKAGNSYEGHFLLLFFGSGFWISSASLPSRRTGGRLWAGRTGTTSLLDHWLMCREDRAWDCALGLTATGMQREVHTVAVAHAASHFRANGSWHRMLWPENLTAQECCARVSFSSAHLTSQAGQNSVLALQTARTLMPGTHPPSQPSTLDPL